jgi:myosin-crossreactive antigen
MQFYLGILLQFSLLILVIAFIVATVQIVLILLDIREVSKRARQISASLKVMDYLFDTDDLKALAKNLKKLIFGILEVIGRFIKRLSGGGEKDA